jgi:hypothetical protein
VANQKKLKIVIIGIDFFSFNSSLKNGSAFLESRLEKPDLIPQDIVNATLSLDALEASKETIIDSFNNSQQKTSKDDYRNNGFTPDRSTENSPTLWRLKSGLNYYFKLHSDHHLSDKYLSDFQKIVELCKQHDIILKVFISPAHATQWEAIRATGRWASFEQWKREIVKIVPVWDFSGYNSITGEKIIDPMKNYADNSHYRQEIGDLILNRLLSYQQEIVPDDFGVLLTSENIEFHLAIIRNERELWVKNNPDAIKLVQDIKQKNEDERHQLNKNN